jgi:PAS domain S-box-containing protein
MTRQGTGSAHAALIERPTPLLELITRGIPAIAGPTVVAPTESNYRAFLDALEVAVYTTDAAGRITFYNEAAAGFWGRRPEMGEEWCGSWRLFWPDGTAMRHDECPMAIALKENRPVRGFEAIVERPDGSRAWFVPFPTPLRADDGSLIGAVNVLVDVTERVQADLQLRAAAESLRVSNAVKDEFLGMVSHELRTPVTTIFGNARLLHERGERLDDAQKRSMIDDIATDADRLMGLIENLLLLTRLESNPQVDMEPQVLDHVIARVVASFTRRHPERRVQLRRDPGHVVVDGDRTYLELVLENLLSNADKYSPPGADIDVILRVTDDEACVLVLDRGIGIKAGEAERVFEPFYRGDAARARANGVGVGLAACRRVVDLLGGHIWARRRRGPGTEFGFALPLSHDTGDVIQ